jgi:hypothetical protein
MSLINQTPCHEDIWGNGGVVPSFLTVALDGGEWSASLPARFTPGEIAHCTLRIGGCVGPRAGLYTMENRKPCSCQDSNPDRPPRGPSPYQVSYPDFKQYLGQENNF